MIETKGLIKIYDDTSEKTDSIDKGKMVYSENFNTIRESLYRVGGICMIAFGLIYIIASILALKLAVPNDNMAFFNSLGANATRAYVVYGLFSLADFVLMPAVIGLYLALRRNGKTAMLIAAGLLFLFIFLDLSVTEFNTLTLVTLAQHYTSATSDAQRMAYIAAADYALATIPLASFYSWVVGSLGLLIASIIMLKGNFGKRTAYVGIILNIAGIIGGFYVFIPVMTLFLTLILIFWGIWLILVGSRLYGLNPVASNYEDLIKGQ